jgi:hypothetical protein
MSTKLKIYTNEDDALLFWSIEKPIDHCRGFAIARRKEDQKGKKTDDFLLNRMGFENEEVAAKQEEGQEAVTKPSTEWPFQRFSWTDHDANKGDTVSYRVIPVIRNASGGLDQLESQASDWSSPKTLGVTTTGTFKPFFNRGFVMSQFMARYLKERKLSLKQFKNKISEKDDKTIRQFLSGDLRLALLAFTVIPLMLLATVLFSRRAKVAYRQTRTSVAAFVGDLAALASLKGERLGNHADGERSHIPGELGDHGCGSRTCATPHAGGNKHHVGFLKGFA